MPSGYNKNNNHTAHTENRRIGYYFLLSSEGCFV